MPQVVARTNVLKNSKNSKWDERFIYSLADAIGDLELQVKDDEFSVVDVLGSVKFLAE